MGGLWDRQGNRLYSLRCGWHTASGPRKPPCHPPLIFLRPSTVWTRCVLQGISDDSLGETVRTRTTVLQAHTHQWVGTFSGATGAGNGEYRGELRQAVRAISGYMKAQSLPLSQAVVRLDGQYGNGAIVADLAGLAERSCGARIMISSTAPFVQARLAQPPDQQVTHPETGTCRSLFDFPDLLLSPTGPRARVIVAAREAPDSPVKVGTTRGEPVYELFYTALPPGAFTSADVVALYLHRGAFETVLADEDKEQELDRWCPHTA